MAIVDPHWPRADTWLAQEATQPDLLVVGVPSSKASLSPSRADLTPGEIRHRFSRFSTFHGETATDFSGIAVRDLGDWPVSELDMHTMLSMVDDRARRLPEVELVLFLGGDNAITRPLVRALDDDLSRVGVITFDAHHDVRSLDNGPTNGTPIRGLIDQDGLPGGNVVQIGIHSFANSKTYRDYCHDQGIGVYTVEDVETLGMARTVTLALNRLAHCDQIYVDVDVDVLDKVFAPGCPGSRPGGLTIRQLANGVRLLGTETRVKAMDFVEVDPSIDPQFLTLDATAHLFLSAVTGLAQRQPRTNPR